MNVITGTILSAAALAAAPAFAAEKTYTVGAFEAVSVSAGIEAIIAVGGERSVRAEGTDEGIEKLDVYVDDDELVIRRKPRMGFSWGKQQQVTVYVTTPTLVALDVSSGASAKATGVDAETFAAEASSGASASIAGRCGTLAADASSGARLDAEALECERVTADGSSGASTAVFASVSLIADASSGASIKVHGSPATFESDESSGGDVSRAE